MTVSSRLPIKKSTENAGIAVLGELECRVRFHRVPDRASLKSKAGRVQEVKCNRFVERLLRAQPYAT